MKSIKKYIRLLLKYYDVYGILGIILFIKVVHGIREKIVLSDIKYPFTIRKNTSDKHVFKQIFIEKEYDISFSINPDTIIDAGANTGLAAIFFSNKYPNAKIISIEPEVNNFKLLLENTKYYKNIVCLQRALSNDLDHHMEIVSVGLGEWGFITQKTSALSSKQVNQLVRSITVDRIMEEHDLNKIDVFKIDIEGSEKELFESNYEKWLPNTKNIIIEFHDRMKSGCKETFLKVINMYKFTSYKKGENYIFVNKDII